MRHWLLPLLQLLIRILTAIEGQKSKQNDFGFWTMASAIWFDSSCCLQGAQRRAAGYFLVCHQRHPAEQQEALIV